MAVTDEAIEKIKGMIVSGALRPGDRLPKESELAARTRAVPQLAAGGGARPVADPHSRRAPGRRHLRHQPRPPTAAGGAELRRGLPPRRHGAGVPGGPADPGAGRDRDGRDPDQRGATGRARRPAGRARRPRPRWRSWSPAIWSSTGGIVQASGNSVLCSLLDGLSGPTTRARVWRGLTQEDAVSRTLHEHRAILSALRDRDAEAARSWATVHVASVEQWLRSTL